MSPFNKIGEAFDKAKDQKDHKNDSKSAGLDAVKQSLAIVKAIDKMKTQGIKLTKKAEFDYLLALRVLERAGVDYDPRNNPAPSTPSEPQPESKPESKPESMPGSKSQSQAPQESIKRTPQQHPQEFQKAMELSKKTIAEVEQMMQTNQPIPVEKMEEYELCKKFLAKFSGG